MTTTISSLKQFAPQGVALAGQPVQLPIPLLPIAYCLVP